MEQRLIVCKFKQALENKAHFQTISNEKHFIQTNLFEKQCKTNEQMTSICYRTKACQ